LLHVSAVDPVLKAQERVREKERERERERGGGGGGGGFIDCLQQVTDGRERDFIRKPCP